MALATVLTAESTPVGGRRGRGTKQNKPGRKNHLGRQKLRLILSEGHGDGLYYSSVYIRNVQNQVTFNYFIILVCACKHVCAEAQMYHSIQREVRGQPVREYSPSTLQVPELDSNR